MVFFAADVPLARAEGDAQVAVLPGIVGMGEVIGWVVEVHVLVVVAAEEAFDVERAAQAEEVADPLRVAERDVRRVVGAEARAPHRHPVAVALPPGEVENVVDDHVFVAHLRAHAIGGMDALVVPTVQINGVRAIHGDPAGLHEPADGLHQPEFLVLVEAPVAGGKQDQRHAPPVAEDQHFKIAAQVAGPPADVAFLHGNGKGGCSRHHGEKCVSEQGTNISGHGQSARPRA